MILQYVSNTGIQYFVLVLQHTLGIDFNSLYKEREFLFIVKDHLVLVIDFY